MGQQPVGAIPRPHRGEPEAPLTTVMGHARMVAARARAVEWSGLSPPTEK